MKDINNSNQLSLKFTSSIAVFMLNILENEDESALQTVTGWGFDKQVLSCQHSQVKCSMLQAEQLYLWRISTTATNCH